MKKYIKMTQPSLRYELFLMKNKIKNLLLINKTILFNIKQVKISFINLNIIKLKY